MIAEPRKAGSLWLAAKFQRNEIAEVNLRC
jgi:hypothetical protein